MSRSQTGPQRYLTQQDDRALTRAARLGAVGALFWLPQAALVAWVFAGLIGHSVAFLDLVLAAGGFVALALVRAWIVAYSEDRLDHLARRVVAEQQAWVLDQEQAVSPYDPQARSSAAIAALVTDKLPMMIPYLTRYRPAMLRVAIVPAVILAIAFSISWAVGGVLLVAGPLIPVFMALIGIAAQKASERQMDEIATLNDLLLERLGALVDTRLLGAETYVSDAFATRSDRLRAQTLQVLRVAFLSSTVLELFAAIGVAMVAVYVGFALLGELNFGAYATPLSPIEGMLLLLLAPDYFQPLRDMGAAWHDRATGRAIDKDLQAIAQSRAARMIQPAATRRPLTGPHTISWSALHFGGDPGVDLPAGRVETAEAVALTGPSGVGKSTLLAALGGVVQPNGGHVSIAGAPLDGHHIDAARAAIAWVPQQPFFFAGSLHDNLTLGLSPVRPLEEALRLARADDIVARLPDGLNSALGETGAGVSGGEARRLMLARAACRGASIVLADEPTADLDDETASHVVDALLALRAQGATVVAASHDPRLIARFDREVAL